MQSGIYSITHIDTGRAYIGSSANVVARKRAHLGMLRRGVHTSPYLQHAWDKHGHAAFVFLRIESVAPAQLLEREQFWIDQFKACQPSHGYNTAPVAGTRAGVPQSEAARASMSAAAKGIPKSAEHRAKIGAANRGKVRSDETKAKIAASVTATMQDPERRAKAAEWAKLGSGTKGKTMSPESRAKMSISAKLRMINKARSPDGKFH
jgi:group I intron endonuclease